MNALSDEKQYVSARFLAKRWNCSLPTVYKIGETGQIPVHRFSEGVVRFDLSDVVAFERERRA
jgi:hypothetical protein